MEQDFGFVNPRQCKGAHKPQIKRKSHVATPHKNSSKLQSKNNGKEKKETSKWCGLHKTPTHNMN